MLLNSFFEDTAYLVWHSALWRALCLPEQSKGPKFFLHLRRAAPTLAAGRRHSGGSTASADQACEAARGIGLAAGECNTAMKNGETRGTAVFEDPLQAPENSRQAGQGNGREIAKMSLSLLWVQNLPLLRDDHGSMRTLPFVAATWKILVNGEFG